VQFGKDAPFVKALRAQLQGMKSMQTNREQNLLLGASERQSPASAPDLLNLSVEPPQAAIDEEAQNIRAAREKPTPKK